MMGEHTLIEAEERSLWSQCLSALKTQISESALNTWFSALEILESSAGEMVIGVPNGFVLEYVSHHYRGIIEKTLEGILHSPVRISFTVLSKSPHLEVFQSDFRSGAAGAAESRSETPGIAGSHEGPWIKSRGPVRIE